MKKLIILIILTSILTLFFCGCFFKKEVPPGTLSGSITWQSESMDNNLVVGATVNVWGTGNKKMAHTVSDSNGRYSIANIPEGQGYMVTCYHISGTSGNIVVEKYWMIQNVNIKSGVNNQLNLTFDNAIKDAVLPVEYR
jgi:hypothetical protein